MTWQPIQILLTSKAGEAYMNPVPIVDERDGTIFLLVNPYFQPYKDVPVHIWLMKSTDDGATWSSPTDITTGTGLKELGPGIGIQMRSGRLVAPVYDGVIFSDDHGKTWKSGGKISDVYSESQVVELVDGSLLLNVRQGVGHRAVGISTDGGQTWSKPRNDMALSDPTEYKGCQGSLIRYSRKGAGNSKNRLLFSNPSDPNHRLNMTVRISYDEGRTWPVAKMIKEGPGGYSSMTVLPDGSIGLVYESGSFRTISFVRFTLEWITGGTDRETRMGN
jgi:sialidase-1